MSNHINMPANSTFTRSILIVLTLSIFTLDMLLPLDIAIGAAYGIVVLITLRTPQISDTYWSAIVGTWLSILVLLLSTAVSTEALINGVLAIVITITTGFLVYNYKIAKERITNLNILSTTDALTLAKNRLAFNEIVPIEILRAKRYNRSLSLAIINIDKFKQLNDRVGRDIADQYLKQLVTKIKSMVRHSDCMYRLDGDEFAIVFVETEMEQVVTLIEEMCKKVANMSLTEKKIKTTISVGVDTCEANDGIDTLLSRTKDALKRSKTLGGNQVTTIQEVRVDSTRVG